jgi:hypothetical protein
MRRELPDQPFIDYNFRHELPTSATGGFAIAVPGVGPSFPDTEGDSPRRARVW